MSWHDHEDEAGAKTPAPPDESKELSEAYPGIKAHCWSGESMADAYEAGYSNGYDCALAHSHDLLMERTRQRDNAEKRSQLMRAVVEVARAYELQGSGMIGIRLMDALRDLDAHEGKTTAQGLRSK